jgi:GntR family transcriptional regulator/MocR family aminotransferase
MQNAASRPRTKRSAPGPRGQKGERAWNQLFKLAPDSGVSLQIQIRRAFVAAILDKRLPPGTGLPSSRVLSAHLNVARNTVNAAYRQLADDGFITALPRSGYHVAQTPAETASPAAPPPPQEDSAPRWAARIGSRYSTMRNISKPVDWHRYPYQFIYGQPDPALFPTADWRACSRAALAVLAIRDWAADMIDGDDSALIEQLQHRVLPRRGIFTTAEQIMITVGTQHALYMLAELLVSAHSVVGIEEPGYPDARNIFARRGAALRPLPLGPEGIEISALTGCDLAYLTPSHQCPSAVTMSLPRRHELLERGARQDFLIIEDDYDSEMTFANSALPALKSLDRSGRVIYLGSLSKTLAPGLRIGFMVAAPELIAEARVLRRLMLRHPPANNQRAAALFISLGHYDTLLRRIKKSLSERANALGRALQTHTPALRFTPLQGGSSVWVQGPERLDSALLAKLAQQEGILIEPGELFFHQPPAPCPYFRLGFAATPIEKIPEGIRRLALLIEAARI